LLKESASVNVGGSWLPDSRGLVFFSFVDRQLYFFELATKKERRLTDEPSNLARWAPTAVFTRAHCGRHLDYEVWSVESFTALTKLWKLN
jgi:hypothetical protein